MVNKEQIKKRLKRFEVLSGLEYSKEAGEIWLEHLQDLDKQRFDKVCLEVEKNIKWHILPTLYNFYEADRKNPERRSKWEKI